jgi:Mn-dependent DtxR family transcriptional regulator
MQYRKGIPAGLNRPSECLFFLHLRFIIAGSTHCQTFLEQGPNRMYMECKFSESKCLCKSETVFPQAEVGMEESEKFHTVRGYQIMEQDKKLLTPAMEDYLEMIYRNSLVDGYLRMNTLSELLNVQASSATKMVQKLTALGLLDYKRYGIIFLTENGRAIGRFLLDRHNIIETFLKNIGVVESILIETELIEHNITTGTLQKIDCLNSFFLSDPEVVERFKAFRKQFEPICTNPQGNCLPASDFR